MSARRVVIEVTTYRRDGATTVVREVVETPSVWNGQRWSQGRLADEAEARAVTAVRKALK